MFWKRWTGGIPLRILLVLWSYKMAKRVKKIVKGTKMSSGINPATLKAGKSRLKVINNAAGHNLPMGTKLTFASMQGQFVRTMESPMNFYPTDLGMLEQTKDELKSEIKDQQRVLALAQAKLEFLEDTGADKVDLDDFREYHLSRILSSDASVEDKTRKLRAVFEDA